MIVLYILLNILILILSEEDKECELIKHGTSYGGWRLLKNIKLTKNSIIYSAGVGEDISFDLIISQLYQSNIILIDPTERSFKHFNEILNFYNNINDNNINNNDNNNNINNYFTANIQDDYNEILQNVKPNLNTITYIKKGLWHKADKNLKFYMPTNELYVSHTLIENMYSNRYHLVEVDTIKNIMREFNHNHIDLLKLDIEGSEIIVLEQMINDEIFPTYLCVEFDLIKQQIDYNDSTKLMIEKLDKLGYKMIDNDHNNCFFELKK